MIICLSSYILQPNPSCPRSFYCFCYWDKNFWFIAHSVRCLSKIWCYWHEWTFRWALTLAVITVSSKNYSKIMQFDQRITSIRAVAWSSIWEAWIVRITAQGIGLSRLSNKTKYHGILYVNPRWCLRIVPRPPWSCKFQSMSQSVWLRNGGSMMEGSKMSERSNYLLLRIPLVLYVSVGVWVTPCILPYHHLILRTLFVSASATSTRLGFQQYHPRKTVSNRPSSKLFLFCVSNFGTSCTFHSNLFMPQEVTTHALNLTVVKRGRTV